MVRYHRVGFLATDERSVAYKVHVWRSSKVIEQEYAKYAGRARGIWIKQVDVAVFDRDSVVSKIAAGRLGPVFGRHNHVVLEKLLLAKVVTVAQDVVYSGGDDN